MKISNSNLQSALVRIEGQTVQTSSEKPVINNSGELYSGPVKSSMLPSQGQSLRTINSGTLRTIDKTVVGSALSDSDKIIMNGGGSIYPDFNKLRLQQLVLAKPGTTSGNLIETATNKQPIEISSTSNVIVGQPFPNLLALGGTEFPNAKKLQLLQLLNKPSEVPTVDEPEQGSESFTNITNLDGKTPLADGTKNEDKLEGKFTSNIPENPKKPENPVKNALPKLTGFFGETLHDPATCKDCKANAENTRKSQEKTRQGLQFMFDQTVGTGPLAQVEKKVFLSWYYIPKLIGNINKFLTAPLDKDLERRLENNRTAIRLRDDKILINRKEKELAELEKQKQDQMEKLTRVQQEHRATLEKIEKGRKEIVEKLNKANPPNGGEKYVEDPRAMQRLEDAYFEKLKEIDEEIKSINKRMKPLRNDIDRIKNRIKETEAKVGLNPKPMPEIETDH